MTYSKHISTDEMMDFVCMSKETFNQEKFSEYFGIVRHLVECEECKKLKNDIEIFLEKLDEGLAKCDLRLDLQNEPGKIPDMDFFGEK